MKKINIFLSILAALSLSACSLDLEPTTATVYDGVHLVVTGEDLMAAEAGFMDAYRAIHNGMYSTTEELMLDGFNATASFGNNYGSVHRTDDSYTSSDDYIDSYWQNHYVVIGRYNNLIDDISIAENVPEGYEEAASIILGEAYFCRAEAYLNLVRHYGKDYDPADAVSLGVPVVLHYDLNGRPARNTVHEVYDQIKNDLDSAAVHLAAVPGELMAAYPTMDCVNALYARYYLDTEDYDNAVTAANTVIATGRYTLSNTIEKLTAEFVNDAGTEAIMQLPGNQNSEPVNSNSVYTSMGNSQDHGQVFNSLYLPSRKLVDSYSTTDIRGRVWLSTTDYYTEINGSYYRGNFATFVKYFGNPNLYSGTPNGAQMIKPYMISEMYLIKAEAQNMGGHAADAKTTLNALQTARGAELTSGSMTNIQNEWFRETVGEGLRLSCLKRWHIGFDAREGQPGALAVNAIMTGTYYDQRSFADDDYHLVWPVPASQIRLNPNLVQNAPYGQ